MNGVDGFNSSESWPEISLDSMRSRNKFLASNLRFFLGDVVAYRLTITAVPSLDIEVEVTSCGRETKSIHSVLHSLGSCMTEEVGKTGLVAVIPCFRRLNLG